MACHELSQNKQERCDFACGEGLSSKVCNFFEFFGGRVNRPPSLHIQLSYTAVTLKVFIFENPCLHLVIHRELVSNQCPI